jgi:tetratricopeptide (TPR) repeat protein
VIAVLWLVFAAGPSSLWEDVVHPNRGRCHELSDEGRRLMAKNAVADALQAFSRATRLCPDEAEPFSLLGSALVEYGDFAAARPPLERARSLYGDDGGDPALSFHLGFVRALSGDLDGSLAEYRRAIALGGLGLADNWLLFYNLGDTLMALGRLAEATDAYRRAVRASNLKPITHLALAVAYDRDQQIERAQRELSVSLSQDPQLYAVQSDQFIFVPAADRHYYLALGSLGRGLRSRARHELREFLRELPDGPFSARARERLAQAEAASPPVELHRTLDAEVVTLEPCVQRAWKGSLILRRANGRLQVDGRSDPCVERWLDRVAPLLPSQDFSIDLEVTPQSPIR